ncbi:MAG TPA: hypothetical protein VFP96_08015 [Candidatus Acidoferrum sp.]|nr:hypothetical protein [Candidatus Acidoferrum sp.]
MSTLRNVKTRRIIFAVFLAVLLVTATTAGSVWHHHNSVTAGSSCPICHLSHQTAQQPILIHSGSPLWAIASNPILADPLFIETPVTSQFATRAPPSL